MVATHLHIETCPAYTAYMQIDKNLPANQCALFALPAQ